MQQRFDLERAQWEATRPQLLKEAKARGQNVVFVVNRSYIGEGPDSIIYSQTLSHRFERCAPTPKVLRPLCGVRCRSGKPCEARVVLKANGTLARRCRLHGGLSTGPRSTQGREAIAEANRRRARPAI
jgi:hypothetical protein